jgi:hypothetical protein
MALSDVMFKWLLILILLLLIADLANRLWSPVAPTVQAQNVSSPIYIEPGVTMLRSPDGSRQVLGKVVLDLQNGNVWGFPTTVQQPFPVDVTKLSLPPLLRFDWVALISHRWSDPNAEHRGDILVPNRH